MNSKAAIYFLLTCCAAVMYGQSGHRLLKNADESYTKQDFNKAEENYRKALEAPTTQKETAQYNLGNSILQQNRPKEAIPYYEQATKKNDPDLHARAWYNLGNAHFQQKEFDKSVEAYKKALIQNPSDLDAKKNLVLAKQQLMKQQQQQQSQQQNESKKENQKQDPPPSSPGNDQQNQPPQENQPKDQNQNPAPADEQKKLTKEEAEQLMDYMEREDQKVQQKLVNKKPNQKKPKKDW
jgi:Ca-activated chloride channel homolog